MAKPEQIKDTRLKAIMTEAHELMRANRPTESVKALAAAFECLLELQPEIIDEQIEPRPGWKAPFLSRWPQLGANFTAGSLKAGEPKIEFVREKFALSEAITYYEFMLETAIKRDA